MMADTCSVLGPLEISPFLIHGNYQDETVITSHGVAGIAGIYDTAAVGGEFYGYRGN
ncbi:hypothetical protein PANT111_30056 [Pantoea brenneri]|uniref:Uncharacterized protein n=1 Tax=Pantoea brenneri TaxID=472694 RepID=A0AAX3J9A2_9GAMM|nr:hypothetical protein PANT111_30056 [Pantoea brenneri]